ncbi:MAG: helix-hairpin-helix domain-containing protein [Dehalococcoidia bacterium]|nr:helix-hairpin-helix domain-containing protein [Dehalococcoidia bacterium]
MISHLHGILRKKNDEEMSVEVEVNGVCYEVFLPMFVWRAFEDAELEQDIELDTFYYAAERQPIPKLIGFKRPVEREFFARFIEVPDVGATRALKALVFSVSTIACWIEEGDIASLRRLPGIGARTAETIVARLRGKVTPFALLRDEGFAEMPEAASALTSEQVRRDAVAGMMGLGFSQREASTLVEEITREQALASVEEVIRAVFQRMQKG